MKFFGFDSKGKTKKLNLIPNQSNQLGTAMMSSSCNRVERSALFLLLLCLSSLLPLAVSQSTDNAVERSALLSIYSALNGAAWTNSTWNVPGSFCDWYGVVCNTTLCSTPSGCRVTELNLNTNNLIGTMPDSICSFPLLTKISMHQNLISGQFPNCWQSNSSLTYVFLSGNNLTGTLPESISKLPNLQEFWVDANRIGGTLPSSWGQLSTLQILSLYTNVLVGSIPPSFGNLSSLVSVYMDMNQINGTIPPELGKLSMISELYASVNQISGTIPPELAQLSRLTALVLFNNRIEGTIPSVLSSLSNLITLSLDTNQLVGTIPSSLGSLMNMEWLSLYSNRLNGTIPSALFNLNKLSKLKLNNNTLTGTIPANIGNMASLQMCLLSNNYFVGTLPESISRLSQLTYLSIGQNQFQGDASTLSRLNNLTALTRLELQQNNFVGNFDLLTSTFSPIFINASFNSFGPVLPDYIAPISGTGISFIDLSNNLFDCPYPESYPQNVVLKLSACLIPWGQYGRYAAILAGAVAFVALVLFGIRRLLGKDRTTIVKFFISWFTFTVAIVMDGLNIKEILHYLLVSTNNCVNFNYHYIFQPVMPYVITDDDKLPKMMSFADWIAKYISMYSVLDPGWKEDRIAFVSLCQSLDQCYVPENELKCVLRSGMDILVPTFSIFFRCVIAIAVVRGCIEIIRLIVILYSCWRGGRVFGGRRTINFIIPSPFSVLLVFSNKSEFYRSVVMHYPKYTDIMRSSLHIGLLTQAPLLAANVYFLLRVTQNGINFANMLSLINGLLLVPRLTILAFTSWLQHRSIIQKHSEDDDDTELHDEEMSIRLDLNTRIQLKESPLIESMTHGSAFQKYNGFVFQKKFVWLSKKLDRLYWGTDRAHPYNFDHVSHVLKVEIKLIDGTIVSSDEFEEKISDKSDFFRVLVRCTARTLDLRTFSFEVARTWVRGLCLMIDAYRAHAKLTGNNPLFIEHSDLASTDKPIGPHDVALSPRNVRESDSDSSSDDDDEQKTRPAPSAPKTLMSIPLPPMIQPVDEQPPLQKLNSRKADQSPRWSGRPPAFVPVQRLPLPLPAVIRSRTSTALASPREMVPVIPVVSNQPISELDAMTFSCGDEPSPRLSARSPRLHPAQSLSALPDGVSPSFMNRPASVPALPAFLPAVIDPTPTLSHSMSASVLDPASPQPISLDAARNMSLEVSTCNAQTSTQAKLAVFNRDKIFRRPSTLPPKRGISLPVVEQSNNES